MQCAGENAIFWCMTGGHLVSWGPLSQRKMKGEKGTPRFLISSSPSHAQLLCRSCCLSKNSKLGQEISAGMVLL